MANGSFGLSGFPTGSSTTSGGATTPFTQKEITVTSVNGFSQGDLVYQYNNDFAPITSAASPGSAVFPIPSQQVINTNGGSSGGTGGFQYVLSNRNNNNPRTMARLSNGNIVWTYNKAIGLTTNHRPCFVVTDENNTVVVAETIIEATNLPSREFGPIVCALSGGGFVVAWVNSSNNLRYGVYTNTGAVTTALQNDTGVTIISTTTINRLSIAPRPVSGGFVVAVLENSTNIIKHRVYGPTGTATYVWTTNNTGTSTSQIPRVAVRSDDTFVVVSTNNVANTFVYYLWSATNTAVSNSNFSATIAQNLGTDVITLTDDRYIFIVSTSTGFFFRTLTGSTLSGTSVGFTPSTASSGTAYVSATPLSTGGWAVVWAIGTNINTNEQLIAEIVFVNVYNSSNTLVSPTYRGSDSTFTGYPFNQIPGSYTSSTNFSILETTGYVHVLTDGYAPAASASMEWARFSKPTFEIRPFTTTPQNVSGVYTAALATGNYAPLSSSVTAAAFYAGTTSTQGWLNTMSTSAQILAASQVLATQTSVDYTQAVSLANGNVVVAWSGYDTNSGVTLYSCKYAIFNGNGDIVLPPTVLGTETTSSSNPDICMAAMPGGKFAIFYKSLYVLSSAGAVLTFTTIASIAISGFTCPDLAILPGDRIVILYTSSGPTQLRFAVYDQNLNLLSGPTAVFTANPYGYKVATQGSDLIFLLNNTSGGYPDRVHTYSETSTNTWTLIQDITYAGLANTFAKSIGLNSGGVYAITHDGTNNLGLRIIGSDGVIKTVGSISSRPAASTRSAVQVGVTSSGNLVSAYLELSSTAFTIIYSEPSRFSFNGVSVPHSSLGGAAFTPALASLVGERMLLAYVSQVSGQKMVLNFTTVNCGRMQGTDIITAGSTVSRQVVPITNTTGYSLVGVATSTAAPGGTGTITVNGSATLNSNYFFAAPGQVFDFSNPVRFGVAGSVLERNVTLQGN